MIRIRPSVILFLHAFHIILAAANQKSSGAKVKTKEKVRVKHTSTSIAISSSSPTCQKRKRDISTCKLFLQFAEEYKMEEEQQKMTLEVQHVYSDCDGDDEQQKRIITMSYLEIISNITRILSQQGQKDGSINPDGNSSDIKSPTMYVDQIARQLVQAYDIDILSSCDDIPISLLNSMIGRAKKTNNDNPMIMDDEDVSDEGDSDEDDGGDDISSDEDEDDGIGTSKIDQMLIKFHNNKNNNRFTYHEEKFILKRNRILGTNQPFAMRLNYLRQSLYLLGPISMDLCAHILSLALISSNDNDSSDSSNHSARQMLHSVLILLSQWLRIAPHITSMVTDFLHDDKIKSLLGNIVKELFQQENSSLSLVSSTKATIAKVASQQYVTIQALYNISKYYSDDRGDDGNNMPLMLNWSFLFTLASDQKENNDNEAMDIDKDDNNDSDDDDNDDGHNILITKYYTLYMIKYAIRWYSGRILSYIMNWKVVSTRMFLQRLNIQSDEMPFVIHPFDIDREESFIQHLRLNSLGKLPPWFKNTHKKHKKNNNKERDKLLFPIPTSEDIRKVLPLHSWLADVGTGIVMYKVNEIAKNSETTMMMMTSSQDADKDDNSNSIDNDDDSNNNHCKKQQQQQRHLIATPTTCRNLALLGTALSQEPYPPPILICGPHGAGKSSILREMVKLCNPHDSLLEIHVDEETDSKTLIGSYTATDIPGEFAWRAGALTRATRSGQWVLLEDVDSVPIEIQASLVKLLKDRLVPLGNGVYEKCHPKFRLFGTCTTASSSSLFHQSTSTSEEKQRSASFRFGGHRAGGKQLLDPSLWRKVHVHPLPYSELKEIADALHPDIPQPVTESALTLLKTLDRSGRAHSHDVTSQQNDDGGNDTKLEEDDDDESMSEATTQGRWVGIGGGVRQPSVRDLFKLLSRISNDIRFELNATYATESQRTLCLAESLDVFFGSCPDHSVRQDFISQVAAPIWGISRDLALRYVETRRPTTQIGTDFIEVGRTKIEVVRKSEFARQSSETFAQTSYSLRLMESISVCIRENEPVLLVGETGCGT